MIQSMIKLSVDRCVTLSNTYTSYIDNTNLYEGLLEILFYPSVHANLTF